NRKAQSLRRRSGKRPGGQLGHRARSCDWLQRQLRGRGAATTVGSACEMGLDGLARPMLRERGQAQEVPPPAAAHHRTSGAARPLSRLLRSECTALSRRGAQPDALWAAPACACLARRSAESVHTIAGACKESSRSAVVARLLEDGWVGRLCLLTRTGA